MNSHDCYLRLQNCRALIRPVDTAAENADAWRGHGRGGHNNFSLDELSLALGSATRQILDSYGVSFAFPEGTMRVQDVAWRSFATEWAEDAQKVAQEAEEEEDAEATEPDAEEVPASEGSQGAQDDEAVAQASPMEVVKDESGKTGGGPGSADGGGEGRDKILISCRKCKRVFPKTEFDRGAGECPNCGSSENQPVRRVRPGSAWADHEASRADHEVSRAEHEVSLEEDELASAEENAGRGRGQGSRRSRTRSQSQESDEDSALPRAFLQGLATEGALRRVLARACN